MPERFHPRIIRVDNPDSCPYLSTTFGHEFFCNKTKGKTSESHCCSECPLEIDKGKIVIRSCETCNRFRVDCWGALATESDGLACWKNKI